MDNKNTLEKACSAVSLLAFVAVASFIALPTTTGCGASPQTSGAAGATSSSLADFCSRMCGRVHTCDTSSDVQTCSSGCEDEGAAFFPKLRPEIVSSIEVCLDTVDCATTLEGNAISSCIADAVASLAPSSEGTSFCNQWSDADKKCDMRFDLARCLNMVKEYSDDTIRAAEACTGKSCEDILVCIEAEFDFSFGGGPSGAVR